MNVKRMEFGLPSVVTYRDYYYKVYGVRQWANGAEVFVTVTNHLETEQVNVYGPCLSEKDIFNAIVKLANRLEVEKQGALGFGYAGPVLLYTDANVSWSGPTSKEVP